MAGLKGKSGPPGNTNAFKHGLTAFRNGARKASTPHEESVKAANSRRIDKSGDEQVLTATGILAEVIASDASWLNDLHGAIDYVIQNKPKAKPTESLAAR